jgi:hypothetical protein
MEALLRSSQSPTLIAIDAFRSILVVAAVWLAVGTGSKAYAQLTAPSVSTGTYTVSWTASSGEQTRGYLLTGSDEVQELPRLVGSEDGSLSALHDVFRSADGRGGIRREDLANHKPVKERPDRREVLFDGRWPRFK